MSRPTRHNLILAGFLVAAAVFMFLWGCPYISLFGHEGLCVAFYILLLLIFVYGRAEAPRRPRATSGHPASQARR